MPTLDEYRKLIDDHPTKWTPDDVHYREAEGRERCGRCLHFYERKLDNQGVCEIMRPSNDEPVEPDMVCDFFTRDGESFPLLEAHEDR